MPDKYIAFSEVKQTDLQAKTHYGVQEARIGFPPVLPLKRLCSLPRTEAVIRDHKFGVYIIYIYIYAVSGAIDVADDCEHVG